MLTRHRARSVLEQMNFVKRKATTAAKIEPLHFDEMKDQYLLDTKAMINMEKFSSELVFNWYHTRINTVPGSKCTMDHGT